ncbi:uncharacterized protein BP01DRAFT_379666 [Aspergillus saccharolyticus JOP 1030-1]|uniref:Uncharacterized protein n=1 Tax=Aspergillus saccharolyticus JOP 1030-1 TaxID=1450539 RepID=A0A318ZPA1_9EURO|nr:hypothetical protein BP01DRAFT_379666 [Aspergillus saccharolyticus JOP 1030-1]PYH48475.1 hypothetical protein BP01DRAFT_379666 [Aspergillus saccharolyticus JOP 1030-1]
MSATDRVQAPAQLPWDPNCTRFTTHEEMLKIPGAPKDAAWVYGGRIRIRREGGRLKHGKRVG